MRKPNPPAPFPKREGGDGTLKAVPHPNRAAKLESYDDGVLVTVPLQQRWWARRPLTWIFPLSNERRVHLDATGAWVLAQCDGRRRVEDVIESLMEKHKLSFQEARVAVLAFMRMLAERGIIVVQASSVKK
jgi:hypothetical protein